MECFICKKPISGRYYSDAFERKMCDSHLNNEAVSCSSCSGFTTKEHLLNDGRYQCNTCFGMALKPGDNIDQIKKNVINSLNRVGFDDLKIEDITIEIVTAQKLSEITKRPINTNNKGIVRSQTSMSGIFGGKSLKHTIFILTHLNKIEFAGSLAHEMLHAWQVQNNVSMSPKMTEGFCNLGAALIWKNQSFTLSKIYAKNLNESPDPIYGDGYREMDSLLQEMGWQELIAKVKNKKIV